MVESDSWRNASSGVELSGKSPKSRRSKKKSSDSVPPPEPESKIVGVEILDEDEGDSARDSTSPAEKAGESPPSPAAASADAPAAAPATGGADDVATCEDCLKQRVVSTRTFDGKPYQLCGNCNRKRERAARRDGAADGSADAGTSRPGAEKPSDFADYMGTLRHKRGAEIASFHPNRCAWWFAGVVTKVPCLVMCLAMLLPLIFSAVVATSEFILDTGEGGFRVVGEPVANRYDAVKLARTESVYRELTSEQQAALDASVLERSQIKYTLQIIFEATDGGSVFRPDHLAKIRGLHESIVTSPEYEDHCVLIGNTSQCLFPQSLLQHMYPEVIEIDAPNRKRSNSGCSAHVTCGQCASDPSCSWCEKPLTGAGRPFRCIEAGVPEEAFCNAIVPLGNCSLEYVYPSGLGEYLVEDPEAVLERLWLNNMSIVEPYVDRGFGEFNYRSSVTTSIFMFGAPYVKNEETGELYSLDDDEDVDKQLELFTDWITLEERSGIADILVDWDDETLDIFFIGTGITDLLIDEIIAGDGALAAGAMIVIGLFMRFHTGSTCLTVSGMTHILISFPTAMFINTHVFGVPTFNMLLTLGIFTVLGIGADNVFLFTDLWKQSSVVSSEISSNRRTRMAWTYQKALHTMSVSTITTAAAFMANGTSSIPPIRQFGLFTGALILVQFGLVVTWFPAAMIVYSRYFETSSDDKSSASDIEMTKLGVPKRSAGAKFGAGTIRAIRLQLGLDGDTDTDDKIDQYRYLERFFFEKFSPFVFRRRKLIFITFGILFAVSGYLATQLEPAKEAARFLPDDDPTQRALDLQEGRFRENTYQGKLAFVFGLEEPDRSDADSNDPSDLGVTRIIDGFSINKLEEQQFLSEFCKDVRAKVEIVKRQQVMCFIEALQEWRLARNESALVPEDEFYEVLRQFTNEYEYPQDAAPPKISFVPVVEFGSEMTVRYDTEGRRDDDLIPLFVSIIANTTLTRDFPAAVGSPIEEGIWDFLNEQMDKAPPGLKGAFHVTHDSQWVRIATEDVLQTSAIVGIFVSLAFAFVIVVIATRNIIIASLVTFTVSGVVLTFIGFMVAAGWSLGIIESISMVVLVGLSCDSLIHISVAYLESDEDSRFRKARQGLLEIGTSVMSAVFTTMLSAVFLMLTTVIFFQRFGIFTFVVMLSSGLHGFLFLVALLMTIGPIGDQGDIVAFAHKLRN